MRKKRKKRPTARWQRKKGKKDLGRLKNRKNDFKVSEGSCGTKNRRQKTGEREKKLKNTLRIEGKAEAIEIAMGRGIVQKANLGELRTDMQALRATTGANNLEDALSIGFAGESRMIPTNRLAKLRDLYLATFDFGVGRIGVDVEGMYAQAVA